MMDVLEWLEIQIKEEMGYNKKDDVYYAYVLTLIEKARKLSGKDDI